MRLIGEITQHIHNPTGYTNKNKNKIILPEKFKSFQARYQRIKPHEYTMYTMTSSATSYFGARTVVAACALVALVGFIGQVEAQATDKDGCRIECYPNTKMINGKGGVGKNDNCRWILRTDGKPARLCDHIKCKKICPNNQAASAQVQDQQEAASSSVVSDNYRVEQKIEADAPLISSNQPAGESMGIMRQMHGNKIAKAPVPGVAGGKLQPLAQQPQQPSIGGRRMAPTLPPVQYDENDTPPPISRFLDISPEE